MPEFGFRVPSFGLRGFGSGFRVPGFGFRVSGFWFRVSSSGFRVLDQESGLKTEGFEGCGVEGLRAEGLHPPTNISWQRASTCGSITTPIASACSGFGVEGFGVVFVSFWLGLLLYWYLRVGRCEMGLSVVYRLHRYIYGSRFRVQSCVHAVHTISGVGLLAARNHLRVDLHPHWPNMMCASEFRV